MHSTLNVQFQASCQALQLRTSLHHELDSRTPELPDRSRRVAIVIIKTAGGLVQCMGGDGHWLVYAYTAYAPLEFQNSITNTTRVHGVHPKYPTDSIGTCTDRDREDASSQALKGPEARDEKKLHSIFSNGIDMLMEKEVSRGTQ